MRRVGLVGLLLARLAVPADAGPSAGEPAAVDPDVAGAALVVEGDAFGKAHQYELALERFLEAARTYPSALHDCYVALAYFRLADLTAARFHLDHAVGRGGDLPGWCGRPLEDQLAGELARRTFLPVTITVTPDDAIVVAGAVRMEGGGELWLPPGTAELTAERDGFAPLVHRAEIPTTAPALGLRVDLRLQPLEVSSDRREPAAPRRRHWIGYAVIAGGVALAAGGAGFHAAALATKDDANQLYARDARFAELDGRFDRQRALAIGGYALGTAAISVGVYLLVRERRRVDAVQVAIGDDHAVVSATWSLGGRW